MNKGQFKKGHKTWNKNLKGIHLSPKSEFKKGQNTLENHPCWKGGVQKNKKDCAYLAVGTNKRVRRPRKIYEDHHGKIPNGFVIYHIDGDKDNDDIKNLKAISRSELLKINN